MKNKKVSLKEKIELHNHPMVKVVGGDVEEAVADYKAGNTKALNFIVGIVMRETKEECENKEKEEL